MRFALPYLSRLLGLMLILGWAELGFAQTLRIGTKTLPSSADPHYHYSGENSSMLPHIYDGLIALDKELHPQPSLATAWRVIDENIWEFDLRKDVYFHDGSKFTAEDIVYTFNRVPAVRNSPGSYERLTRRVKKIEVLTPHRIRFHTDGPHPSLDHDLAYVMILPHHLGLDVETTSFNAGTSAIGTGPYKFVEWVPGQFFKLERNANYWGGTPTWTDVVFTAITSDPTRIAALLNDQVDLTDFVPLADRESLGKNPHITLHDNAAARLMFIHMDSDRDVSPYITDIDGRPFTKNPLKDARVRRALSKALDRQAIVTYLLDGAGIPASQILPASFEGSSPDLLPDVYDVEGAKKLLAEAGYPNGFRLVLHSPSDRYPNDAKVAQAIAQMWWRIGVLTEVETQTRNIFFPAAARQEFSVYFSGWGDALVANALLGLVHTYDAESGFGSGNRARYSNSEVDTLIETALTTLDKDKQIELLERAQAIAFREDQGLIPLYHPTYSWASSNKISYRANLEGRTQAMLAKPKQVAP
ncbi:MAG: ABC transporter substrate-binding protein [Robiginitomaculum sp.]|nr:MAG: ABC transporter substrate-binding protein [Robiginitomaculum sp.]